VAGRLGDVVISVQVAESVDDELCVALGALVPQLSTSSPPPTPAELERIVAEPATTLLIARDDDRIVGMLTLAVFRIPTGVRAWIEDVVVDDAARGAGVAGALVEAALRQSSLLGARTVDLTSRPDREAANRLYVRLGFETRRTNVYRRTLEAPAD
jgi:ribosomal protein S18 acetylase RimI-like enzyme